MARTPGKSHRRLTLTYGLRWDINPPLKGKNLANDPFTVTGSERSGESCLGASRYSALPDDLWKRSAASGTGLSTRSRSRIGSSVLRGGFGIFYDLGSGSLGGVSSYFPYTAEKVIAPVAFPLSPQDAAPPALTTNPPVSNIHVADPNLKLPRTYQWNVALEQSLGSSQSLSLTYIGAIGRDLLRATNLLSPNAEFRFCRCNHQFGNVELQCAAGQVPAASVARTASFGVVYLVPLD